MYLSFPLLSFPVSQDGELSFKQERTLQGTYSRAALSKAQITSNIRLLCRVGLEQTTLGGYITNNRSLIGLQGRYVTSMRSKWQR